MAAYRPLSQPDRALTRPIVVHGSRWVRVLDPRVELDQLSVPASADSIGRASNEAYCRTAEVDGWHVFYSERGRRNAERVFSTDCRCQGGPVFAYQRIEIAGSGVVFTWFPLYRRRLALASIADARVVDVDPWSFGGWGLRLHARGVALTNRGRQGVSVTSTSGRTTIISVENPDRYIHALARHGVPTT